MSARAERRHPEKVAVDPAVCEPARKRTREEMRALGVIGGYARAANLSEEEMREQMRRVRAARTAKDDARRAEQGLPPRVPTPKPLSDEEEAFWLTVVDERFPGMTVRAAVQSWNTRSLSLTRSLGFVPVSEIVTSQVTYQIVARTHSVGPS